jgi:Family of unknown function (DUF6314)
VEVTDPFEFLLGAWSVERAISDYESQLRGWFVGTATLRPVASAPRGRQPRRANYDEVGRLHFGPYDGQSGRHLEYVFHEDGTILINFADGRRFIECDLRSGLTGALHPCGEDLHQVTFEVPCCGAVKERWRVRGPSTDYEAWTTLRRSR